MTLPTFICLGDTYFHEKLLHVNAMITEFGLPSIFITLIIESKWTQDLVIHSFTFHTPQTGLKCNIWCKPDISNWGEFYHFFERVEFQNRGTHTRTHTCIWVSKNMHDK